MAKKTAPLLPGSLRRLERFGDRLRLARLRRRLTAKQLAERAGMTPATLRSLERGGSGVTIGAYLSVMQVLGVEHDLDRLVDDDALGRELQDAALPQRSRNAVARAPTSRRAASSAAETPSRTTRKPAKEPDWTAAGSFVSSAGLADMLERPKARTPRRKR